MSIQDFLYLSLAIGFIVFVGFISYAAYALSQTLKSLKRVLDTAGDLTEEVENVKNQIKSGMLTALLTGLNLFLKKSKSK